MQLTSFLLLGEAAARSFYISLDGNDQADGSSPNSAWRSLAPLQAVASLGAGDVVRLRSGDSWTGQLRLAAQGAAAAPVVFEAYGNGAMPVLQGTDPTKDLLLTLESASHVQVRGLHFHHAKVGLYLRYDGNQASQASQVSVDGCQFSDIDDREFDPTKQPFNHELSYSSGIWLGGVAPKDPAGNHTVLDGLTVSDSHFQNVALGVGCNWYWIWPSSSFFGYFKNLEIVGNTMRDVGMGVALSWAESVHIENLDVYGAGKYAWPTGTTALFLQYTNQVVVEKSRLGATRRIDETGSCADGVGLDLEGCNHNVQLRQLVIQDCQGPALLQMASEGRNSDVVIDGLTAYNNAKQPYEKEVCMMQSWESCDRCSLASSSILTRKGVPAFSSKWDSFSQSAVDAVDEAALLSLPTSWSEGSAWTGFDVALTGWQGRTTSGRGHIVAETWANGFDCDAVLVQLQVSAGSQLVLQFLTDADRTWDDAKRVAVPLGSGPSYVLNLRQAAGWQGVIRQVALFPTDISGADFSFSSVAFRCAGVASTTQLLI